MKKLKKFVVPVLFLWLSLLTVIIVAYIYLNNETESEPVKQENKIDLQAIQDEYDLLKSEMRTAHDEAGSLLTWNTFEQVVLTELWTAYYREVRDGNPYYGQTYNTSYDKVHNNTLIVKFAECKNFKGDFDTYVIDMQSEVIRVSKIVPHSGNPDQYRIEFINSKQEIFKPCIDAIDNYVSKKIKAFEEFQKLNKTNIQNK